MATDLEQFDDGDGADIAWLLTSAHDAPQMRREFASDDYPERVASYAAALARRYKGRVRWYTPLNEPLVNALMCGKRALWPPYLRGDAGYIRIMLQIVKGILRTVDALKEVDPDAVMVHVEAAGLSRAARADLEALAVEDQRRGFLSYDLLTGRVTPEHPLFTWLRHEQRGLLGSKIRWNFTKFLVDRDGRVLRRFGTNTTPDALRPHIEKALAKAG